MRYKNIVILSCLFVLLLPALVRAKTVKIAVMPWKVNSAENMDFVKNAMTDMLASRLGSRGDVVVVRPDIVKDALGSESVTDVTAAKAGKKLSADFVLYGSITVFGSSISLDAKLADVADGTVKPVYSKGQGLDSVVGMADKLSRDVLVLAGADVPAEAVQAAVPSSAAAVAAGVIGAADAQGGEGFIIKQKEGPKPVVWRSAPMEGLYTSMAAADLDRDGKKELFIISSAKLVVARPKADGIEVVKEFVNPIGYANVAVAAADADNDGADELYVSKVHDNRPSSAAIEYRGGAYAETITGVGWLLRAVRTGKGVNILAGQKFMGPDGFFGAVAELKKEGGKIVEKGVLEEKLPDGVDLYRFGLFDFTGDGNTDLVAIDERNYLRVYRKEADGGWAQEWKSTEFYGGTLNLVAFSKNGINGDAGKVVPVEGNFFHTDTDGDGKEELLIKRNVPGGLGRWAERPVYFKTAEVYSLSWDAAGVSMLKENWKSKQVDGYMADFFMDDLDRDGSSEITMLITDGTEKLFGTPKTYVLSYRVSI